MSHAACFSAAVAVAVAVAVATPAAAGQDKPLNLAVPSLSDAEMAARLKFLEERLDSEQFDAELWQYGWTAFNGGSMIGEAALAATTNNGKDRASDAVQSAEALVGVLGLTLNPLPARFGSDPVRALPDATPEDRANQLSHAEDLLEGGAAQADDPYELMPHIGVLAINLLGGAAIWKLADFTHAYQAVIPGILIGELQVWTTPQGPADDLKDYRARTGSAYQPPTWELTAMPGGVGISVRF